MDTCNESLSRTVTEILFSSVHDAHVDLIRMLFNLAVSLLRRRLCSIARFGHIGISCPSCCRHGFATKANCEPTMLCDQKLLHKHNR